MDEIAEGWRYLLARASDMELIGELRGAHDRTLGVDLNKSGTASTWLPTSSPVSRKVSPWSTALVAQHDDIWYWSGLINSRTTDMAAGRVAVNAFGWFERLMHLQLQAPVSYTNQDASTIAADLLAKAIEQDPNLPITLGTVESTQLRNTSWPIDHIIGTAITELVELESGFDWYIDPVTRTFNIVARRGIVRPECRWTFIGDGKSKQSNLSNCVETVGGDPPANQIRPRGKYASGFAEDAESIFQYGVFQETPSLSDVIDQDILNAFANAEIVYRSNPRITYTMTPKPSSKASVPRLFRDFDVGDTGFLTARRDYIDVQDQAQRIFGVGLSIQDSGTELLTNLQTTAS